MEIQFYSDSYTVLEGGEASLMVVLSNEVAIDITVDIEIIPTSAGLYMLYTR